MLYSCLMLIMLNCITVAFLFLNLAFISLDPVGYKYHLTYYLQPRLFKLVSCFRYYMGLHVYNRVIDYYKCGIRSVNSKKTTMYVDILSFEVYAKSNLTDCSF